MELHAIERELIGRLTSRTGTTKEDLDRAIEKALGMEKTGTALEEEAVHYTRAWKMLSDADKECPSVDILGIIFGVAADVYEMLLMVCIYAAKKEKRDRHEREKRLWTKEEVVQLSRALLESVLCRRKTSKELLHEERYRRLADSGKGCRKHCETYAKRAKMLEEENKMLKKKNSQLLENNECIVARTMEILTNENHSTETIAQLEKEHRVITDAWKKLGTDILKNNLFTQ